MKTVTVFRPLLKLVVLGLLLNFLTAPRLWALEPCCQIVGIKGNVVVARNKATGEKFNFTVNDSATLRSLKVGKAFTATQRDAWMQSKASSKNASHGTTDTNAPKAGSSPSAKPSPSPKPRPKGGKP